MNKMIILLYCLNIVNEIFWEIILIDNKYELKNTNKGKTFLIL